MTLNLDRLFPGGASLASVPWPRASRLKSRHSYDRTRVWLAIAHPDRHDLVEAEPSCLYANQPGLTRAGVTYYLTDRYRLTGRTYADYAKRENRLPLIYAREDGQTILLAGHHRAAAAWIASNPLLTLQVEGPWGPYR